MRCFGWCSSAALNAGCATFIWKRPDGTEIEISGTDDNPECSHICWDDKGLVGEVMEFVRKGQPGRKYHGGE